MKSLLTAILFTFVLGIVFSCTDYGGSSQLADPDFVPQNTQAHFSQANSPTVFIDEAHNNFHTVGGRFKPFAQVLLSDGFTVKPNTKHFTLTHLKHADILVIANALDANRQDWTPPYLDAFSLEEVQAIKDWVQMGGSLLLIADHTPFPRAAQILSNAFGFKFSNGHVESYTFTSNNDGLPENDIFYTTEKVPKSEPMLVNLNALDNINTSPIAITRVKTFGGSAFQIPANAQPLLTLGEGAFSLEPQIPFQINSATPKIAMKGWHQGAALEVGNGRVAVFAEAMMFTSQIHLPTKNKMGLVSPGAEQNEQLLLHVMRWLAQTP